MRKKNNMVKYQLPDLLQVEWINLSGWRELPWIVIILAFSRLLLNDWAYQKIVADLIQFS